MQEVILTGFSNVTKEGVVLHTNIPARLSSGRMPSKETWVSWDKIGMALFEDYTNRESVEDRDKLPQQFQPV